MVRTEGLARAFGAVRALEGLDLTVARGEVLGLLGPNGAGKTTTVRILATLLTPTAGRAWIGGYDVVTDAGGQGAGGVSSAERSVEPGACGGSVGHVRMGNPGGGGGGGVGVRHRPPGG